MNLLADENAARQIVDRLRQEGHVVTFVVEVARGSDDVDVLELANRQSAILLTDDTDFGNLIVLQRRPSAGIILMRLEGLSPAERAELVAEVIRTRATELPGAFTVIKPHAVRIRALPQ